MNEIRLESKERRTKALFIKAMGALALMTMMMAPMIKSSTKDSRYTTHYVYLDDKGNEIDSENVLAGHQFIDSYVTYGPKEESISVLDSVTRMLTK